MRTLALMLIFASIPNATGQVVCRCTARDDEGRKYHVGTACFSEDSFCEGRAWTDEIIAACRSEHDRMAKSRSVKVRRGRSFVLVNCD